MRWRGIIAIALGVAVGASITFAVMASRLVSISSKLEATRKDLAMSEVFHETACKLVANNLKNAKANFESGRTPAALEVIGATFDFVEWCTEPVYDGTQLFERLFQGPDKASEVPAQTELVLLQIDEWLRRRDVGPRGGSGGGSHEVR